MSDAREASIILSPLKKKILYVKTPVAPRRITPMKWAGFITGNFPSTFQVTRKRQTAACANLKKEAENGPTFLTTTLPAIKVPPQNAAVNNNFKYKTFFFGCIGKSFEYTPAAVFGNASVGHLCSYGGLPAANQDFPDLLNSSIAQSAANCKALRIASNCCWSGRPVHSSIQNFLNSILSAHADSGNVW